MIEVGSKWTFPDGGKCYDFKLDVEEQKFVAWVDLPEVAFHFNKNESFEEIVVPTSDSLK